MILVGGDDERKKQRLLTLKAVGKMRVERFLLGGASVLPALSGTCKFPTIERGLVP